MKRLDQWGNDLRLAARGLWRARGFSATAILTLALGIAGTTVMFALIDGVLLRPLPLREPQRLIVAWKDLASGGSDHWPFRKSEIETIGAESRLLEGAAGMLFYGATAEIAVEDGSATQISNGSVTGNFFAVLGVQPILGRALSPADDLPGAENVLVITHDLWQRRYGGSPDAIGRVLTVSEHPFRVVGVMPPDVAFPRGVEAWMTVSAQASTLTNPAFREGLERELDLVARLRPGATLEQARGELLGLVERLEAAAPPGGAHGSIPVVRGFADVLVGDLRTVLVVLFAAVGLVLVIASANVANLMLLRGEARRSELAVRSALGAGPGRIAGQLLAEGLLLALAAGGVGLAVAPPALRAFVAFLPDGLPRVESVRIDAAVVLFTLAVAIAAAALAALVPALRSGRIDLVAELRSGRQAGRGGGAPAGRRPLVVAQAALAVTVLAGAGLLTRSLLRLQAVDLGMPVERLVLVQLLLPQAKYAERARHLQLLDDLVARLEATPAIDGATPVNTPPFGGGWLVGEYSVEGQSPEEKRGNASLNLEAIHPGYFATFEVAIVRGRSFTEADAPGAAEVAIVSEDVAARSWPGQDPIGKRLRFGDPTDPWRTVVGVVRKVRYRQLTAGTSTLYVPAPQFIVSAYTLVLRTASPLELVAGLARERVRDLDPSVQVLRVAPFEELLAVPLARPRFNAFLLGLFGLVALTLATVGLYAVVGASVRHRYAEIGIRVALGATASDVRGLVIGEGLRLAGLGAAIGLGAAVAASRLLRGLLFEVSPADPTSMLGAALVLVGASALACYLPARLASRLDPVTVLRDM